VTNLLIYWYLLIANWCTEELIRDFFETISSKAAKVVKQAVTSFTPFTGFDLARSKKSQQEAVAPDCPSLTAVHGGHSDRY
jgi:hypothetical protein